MFDNKEAASDKRLLSGAILLHNAAACSLGSASRTALQAV
jgi:hypothetical protein